MAAKPNVILYRYDASPFSRKIDNTLLLKKVPHQFVNVSLTLPRPEITVLLGINYRRIPILAIGNDVYCDTSLIVSALERRFPPADGYGTIFPLAKHGRGTDTGALKVFAQFYADSTLFSLAPALLPWDRFPEAFIKDRSALRGAQIDLEAMKAGRGAALSQLSSHLALLEQQLSDGREWLFDTQLPSLADISVHFVLAWVMSARGPETLFDPKQYPKVLQWIDRLSDHVQQQRKLLPAPAKITGDEAAENILKSSHEDYDVVGFDTTEANRLDIRLGDTVQVAPTDNARDFPVTGKLVALNQEEVVIQVQALSGIVNCHLPRLTFSIKRAAKLRSKL
ncbi:hypothetical protein BDN72DRAFT_831380 [Pluteus cervinus]|uniref:Uncharacterized protein n=1 Tax=Pluteus cervinus TaxID=181527 RepID=A0ACD3BDZ5_9AGAR|nr:hypothetical protein BDN72DRAFT_831380 [Pluteus cervinus]